MKAKKPTLAETVMFASLVNIARTGKCPGCRWDDPCSKCFASDMVHRLIEWPQFKSWKDSFKVVRKQRPRRKKGGDAK